MIVNINSLLQDRDLVHDHHNHGDLDRDLHNHGDRGLNGSSKKLMIEVAILLLAPKVPEGPEALEDPEVPGGTEALEAPEGPKAQGSTIQVEIHIKLKKSHVLGKFLYLVSLNLL